MEAITRCSNYGSKTTIIVTQNSRAQRAGQRHVELATSSGNSNGSQDPVFHLNIKNLKGIFSKSLELPSPGP